MLQSVTISKQALESGDAYAVVQSNIDFLNLLFQQHLRIDEVAPESLCSYCVDYYLTQVNNGGFAQFVFNSGCNATTNTWIADGLLRMGATRHAELFARSMKLVEDMPEERLQAFFDGELFGPNVERDILNGNNDAFFELNKHEDIVELNSRWLRSLPNIAVIDEGDFPSEAERLGSLLPDRAERAAQAAAAWEANRPDYDRHIHALCDAAGLTLDRITAGDPAHTYEGERRVAWHFLTDRGHYYYVAADEAAILFDGTSRQEITRVALPLP